MADDKLLIKNGILYDGTGSNGIRTDLYVKGNRIAAVEPYLEIMGARVIDAKGCMVTPGFIDIHRHCDVAPLIKKDFGKLELAQGITGTMVGNCGLAPVPSSRGSRKSMYDYIEPVVGGIPESLIFEQYQVYKEALKKQKLPIHMGFLAAAGAVKTAVKGFSASPFTETEMDRAIGYINEAMDQGAFGMSAGLMYQPECFSAPDDYVKLLKPVAQRDGIFCTHIRGEGDSLVQSIGEVIEIAERAGVRLNISHLKSTGMKNWNHLIWKGLEKIEQARAGGLRVTADFYPYAGGSTTLMSLLPPSVVQESVEKTVSFLSSKEGREKFRLEIYKSHEGWDNMVTGIGWERILISSVVSKENAFCQGKSIGELARQCGYNEPADFVSVLMEAENGKVGIIVLSMSEQDVETVAGLPYTVLISDGLYGAGDNPHPRLYGAFPAFLKKMVLEKNLMTIGQGIHKMTGLPAERLKISERGVIAPGKIADILILNPESLTDKADYQNAKRMAEGVAQVIIDGRPVNGEDRRGCVLEFGKC